MPFKGPNPPPEPTDYDPSNKFKDPVVYYQHKEAAVAEEFIKVAEARVSTTVFLVSSSTSVLLSILVVLQLIKKKLSECYRREGVNHVTACKEVGGLISSLPTIVSHVRHFAACRTVFGKYQRSWILQS